MVYMGKPLNPADSPVTLEVFIDRAKGSQFEDQHHRVRFADSDQPHNVSVHKG